MKYIKHLFYLQTLHNFENKEHKKNEITYENNNFVKHCESFNQRSSVNTNSFNLGPLPTSLNISQNELPNMLDIHWSSEGTDYCVQYSHIMRGNGNWNYAATAFYTLPLENKTYEMSIALHSVMSMVSNFTIGKCRATGLVLKNSNI